MIFSFSSYPLQLPVFIVTFGGLLVACLSGADRWQWLGLAVSVGIIGGFRLKNDLQVEQACREWMNARVLYNAGAYQSAEKEYGRLYPLLRTGHLSCSNMGMDCTSSSSSVNPTVF